MIQFKKTLNSMCVQTQYLILLLSAFMVFSASANIAPSEDGLSKAQIAVVLQLLKPSNNVDTVFTNAAPIADAGENQNVKSSILVSLDGSASSDANGDSLFYTWSFVSKPTDSTAVLDDATLVNPSFTADVDGSYILSLTVNNGLVDSQVDTITINVAEGMSQLFLDNSAGTFNEVAFSSTTTVTDLPTSNNLYSLATYKLVAPSSELTITNLQATELNRLVTPYFENLAEDDEISPSNELIFTLVTPLINSTSLKLSFSFDILETGDTFSSEFEITASNVVLPIVRIEPKYPGQAARDGTEGWVRLQFTVNEVGGVEDVVVIEANPKRVFDREARRALGKWKFKPQIIDGVAVKIFGLSVLFEFNLQKS
jgi:TonB family protein